MKRVLPVVLLSSMVLFAVPALAQTTVVVIPLGGKKAAGDVVAAEVLEGKTFSNKDEVGIDGAMVNNDAMTFHPGTADQTVPEGYHNGSGIVQGDVDLVSGNIRSGVALFGVDGSAMEPSGTATADQVLAGQTFSNVSGAATGSMTNVGAQNITPGATEQTISQGYHNGSGIVQGDVELVSGNIRSGVALFGVTGTTIEASGTAAPAQVLAGQTFSNASGAATGSMTDVGAQTITPGTSAQPISQGYHDGTGSVAGDAALISGNIRSGVALFGVSGTTIEASGTAAPAQVLAGQTFSSASGAATGSMTDVGAQTITPGTSEQPISQGYHDGTGSVAGDAALVSGNIRSGVALFGVTGTTIEASGTAAPAQVLSGQTFSSASGAATGSMTNVGEQSITPGTSAQPINQGYHNGSGSVAGDAALVSGNIRSGVALFGVDGDTNVVNTGSGDAAAGEILSGKKAWVDGGEVTGSMPTQTLSNTTTAVAAGYYAAADLAVVATGLRPENIMVGVTLFGVTGTASTSTVTSPTGQVWMVSNLGTSQVATSQTDPAAYGDLYQWGRPADGHQSRTSLTTSTLSTTDVPGHGSFIRAPSYPYDWRSPQNADLWQGVSGTNNPCPAGFRLPTETEWNTERLSWGSNNNAGAFASPLKLVPAGYRNYVGALSAAGSVGIYWSSTVNGSNGQYLFVDSVNASMGNHFRVHGYSVRCLQD